MSKKTYDVGELNELLLHKNKDKKAYYELADFLIKNQIIENDNFINASKKNKEEELKDLENINEGIEGAIKKSLLKNEISKLVEMIKLDAAPNELFNTQTKKYNYYLIKFVNITKHNGLKDHLSNFLEKGKK